MPPELTLMAEADEETPIPQVTAPTPQAKTPRRQEGGRRCRRKRPMAPWFRER